MWFGEGRVVGSCLQVVSPLSRAALCTFRVQAPTLPLFPLAALSSSFAMLPPDSVKTPTSQTHCAPSSCLALAKVEVYQAVRQRTVYILPRSRIMIIDFTGFVAGVNSER